MKAGVFIKGDIEIRRLKSGRWVLEAEWQQYVEINNVCSPGCFAPVTPEIG